MNNQLELNAYEELSLVRKETIKAYENIEEQCLILDAAVRYNEDIKNKDQLLNIINNIIKIIHFEKGEH